jgi:hypothetical protein
VSTMKKSLATVAVTSLATCLATCLAACTGDPDDSENLFPQWDAQRDAAVRDAFVGGPFPAAWRFECIHIFKLGEPTPSGMPPFQATVLNRLWQTDVTDHRLNILIGIDAFNPETKQAEVFIGSGVGIDDATQCREPTTDGTRFEAPISLDTANHVAQHDPAQSAISCVVDAPAGTEAYGTVNVEVPSTDAIYIYAQNAKEIPFNCTPDPALPQAVPLRYVSADVTLTKDTGEISGELTACLTKADISQLCSCIGDCLATDKNDVVAEGAFCAGCPRGAAPLTAQLNGLISSPACTAKTGGAEAYELKASFFARRLPGQPEVCGP